LADFFNDRMLGEWATRVSVWFALVGYFLGAALAMRPAGGPKTGRLARAAWTWGAAWCLVHLACAFHYYHAWSHADAYRRTADQTALTTGIHWGGGLWLNYAMTVAWLTDTGWWWLGPLSRARRPRGVSVAWQVCLWFMVFNATAVFGHGAVRLLGGLGCGWLMLLAARYTFFANVKRLSSP
jgi:hypothetical protein